MLSYRAERERAQWRQPPWVVTLSTWMSVLNKDPTAPWVARSDIWTNKSGILVLYVLVFLFFLLQPLNNYHQSLTHLPLRIIFPLIKENRVVSFSLFTLLTHASSISILPPTDPPPVLAGEEGSPLAVPPLAVLFNFTVSRGWAWIHYRKPSAHCDRSLKCLN